MIHGVSPLTTSKLSHFPVLKKGSGCPHVADIVAKRFWVSEEATLIQDQPAIRKVDSKICSLRFDCCAQAPLRRLLQQYRPVADARVAGTSVRNLIKFRRQIASPVDTGRRCNRRPHPAPASEKSCRRRGHGSSSARDPLQTSATNGNGLAHVIAKKTMVYIGAC
jgi:hypothetical protein